MVQLFHQRLKYFDFTNMLEITLYISTFLYVIPCNEYKSSYQRNFGALAILAGWLDLILYVRRISFHGIYIIMISTMLITLFQVLILVVIFIFAFGCAFMVLYTKEVKTVFKSMADALFTTFLMMLGELTIDPNLSNLIKAHPVGVIVFIVFCLMMVIIIINLLVGLAVGDIDKIRQNAVYKRHIMQIDLLIELEGTLPASLLKRFYISRLEQFPSEESSRLSEIFTALSPFSAADQNLREIKSLHYLNESRLDLNLDEETASKGITINKNSNNGSLQQQSVATDIKENNGILRGVQSLIRRK
ncbi:Transient receptor potential cation channel subfamily A member 1 [Trichoplax sp. H2]|uniref:Ion transport domain-containing protein n=1 Tax=Trichoplax adhaerens TaxID=10228 RepID=B3RKU2_TRIAD|nr:hypothetical protein TRIADDRAFT_51767 [Trichoplax adhaerens]EDV28645.1 hypothetical protein TRIADDRAFT_51767 [Trichoplax adhaerens]RDD37048.1 Transient receptor potential cation channel subfamily A member 1 [Trichoplax sp. H2]|eukprot:XP_002107847.1 hypothetical protein TRIADDRAFT_51767 [Trichoplax adhaerens]